jgi:hypothetical protein
VSAQWRRVRPEEPGFFVPDRIDHEADTVRLVEERALRRAIGAAEERAEVGMAVIPADDHPVLAGQQRPRAIPHPLRYPTHFSIRPHYFRGACGVFGEPATVQQLLTLLL